ncbi:MAG TPA: regulatory protein RecX [Pyrinomonadaceae bacterium]|jgi:regulatory protein
MFRKRWSPKTESDEPVEIKDVEKARKRTMERAIRLLAAKPRSIGELRERLLEKNWTNAEIVETVLQKLEEYKFVNDEQFAHDFAASKLRQKPVGKRRLQQSLQQKQLDKETVEHALEQVYEETPEADLVEEAIKKRIRLKGLPENRDETKKFYDYLMRQGFSYGLINDKMRAIAREDFDENE